MRYIGLFTRSPLYSRIAEVAFIKEKGFVRAFSSFVDTQNPPPPPPPPPSRLVEASPIPRPNQVREKYSFPFFLLGSSLIIASGLYFLWSEKDKSESDSVNSILINSYLRELADRDDKEAESLLNQKYTGRVGLNRSKEDDFRLDISKDGITNTLNFLLETKRLEERILINEVRQGRAPANYESELRRMKKEKREIKHILKGLSKT